MGTPHAHPARSPRVAALAALACAALLAAAAWPLILSGSHRGRGAYDSINFHEKVIRTFIAQWPHPDLHNYISMTTPGYHLLLAAAGRTIASSTTALQLLASFFSLGLIALLAWITSRRAGPALGIACTLPIAACVYVYTSAVWLLPDNAGWLGCLAILALALRPRFNAATAALAGLLLLALVLVRQIHLWTAAPLITAAWLGVNTPAAPQRLTDLFRPLAPRILRAALTAACCLPAAAAVAWFFHLWGGPFPPCFQAQGWIAPPNPTTPALILALTAAYGAFYAPFWIPGLAALWREHRAATIALALSAFALGLTVHATPDPAAGRWGGVFDLLAKLPMFREHSPVLALLSSAGALVIAALAHRLPFRDRWIILSAWVAFTAAHTSSHWLFQRYCEPWVLILLSLMAALIPATDPPPTTRPTPLSPRTAILGPLALSAILALVTAAQISRSAPAGDEGFTPQRVQPAPAKDSSAASHLSCPLPPQPLTAQLSRPTAPPARSCRSQGRTG